MTWHDVLLPLILRKQWYKLTCHQFTVTEVAWLSNQENCFAKCLFCPASSICIFWYTAPRWGIQSRLWQCGFTASSPPTSGSLYPTALQAIRRSSTSPADKTRQCSAKQEKESIQWRREESLLLQDLQRLSPALELCCCLGTPHHQLWVETKYM